ncbi:MAG: VWA domain-containing protein [Candidatus Binatia bacterium]|nr:VWA domain-containing protein [Candidatus Binatia bacterium]
MTIPWYKPTLLVLLALVPLLVVLLALAERRRRRAYERFAALHLWHKFAPSARLEPEGWSWAVPALTVVLLTAAAAGPQWGFRWQEVRGQGIDLVIALDTSRSMLAQDVKPSRLLRAKLEIQDLVKKLRGDRVALVAFAGTAFTQCPLTLDYNAFLETLRATDVGIVPRGGTSLAAAIRTALQAFEGHEGTYRAVVLLTDGEDHEGGVDEAIELAAQSGVRIYTVGVGSPEGELIPTSEKGQGGFLKDRRGQVVKSRLDEVTLQKIAEKTGGAFLRGSTSQLGLETLYEEHLAKLDKRERKSTLEKRMEHRFWWLLAPAVLLLVFEPYWLVRRAARQTRGGQR